MVQSADDGIQLFVCCFAGYDDVQDITCPAVEFIDGEADEESAGIEYPSEESFDLF